MGATPINVRLPPKELEVLDAWIAQTNFPEMSRPEALRRLEKLGLFLTASNEAISRFNDFIDQLTEFLQRTNNSPTAKERVFYVNELFSHATLLTDTLGVVSLALSDEAPEEVESTINRIIKQNEKSYENKKKIVLAALSDEELEEALASRRR